MILGLRTSDIGLRLINLPLMRLLLKRIEVFTWKQESSLSPKGDSPANNEWDFFQLILTFSTSLTVQISRILCCTTCCV